jgi:hypothetical protein
MNAPVADNREDSQCVEVNKVLKDSDSDSDSDNKKKAKSSSKKKRE